MLLSSAPLKQLADSSLSLGRDMCVDFDTIFAAVDLANATRVERFDEFEIFVEDELTQAQAHVIALALLGIGTLLPSRDRFEITISVDGEAASACNDGEESRARIGDLFDLGSNSLAEVGFRVIIRKQVQQNSISVYDMEAFGRYLVQEPLQQVLEALAARFDGHLCLICIGLHTRGGSATLQLVPEGHEGPALTTQPSVERERTIALFKETSFSASLPGILVPQDFQLDTPLGHPAVDEFFTRASAVLCAVYLCNNAELDSDNTLSYRMAGYKVLEEKRIPVAALSGAHEVLSKIASWAYDAGGSTDKVGLARNVLSLHVASLCDLASQPHVLNAILSNYQIYLKDNVSAYLEVRNRMAELLLESTAKTHALVESLLDSVRNGMLVVFTFVLTVVVVNGLKDTSAKVIFSGEYLWIVIIITALCSIWIHYACNDVVTRFDSVIRTTTQLLRDSYRNVLIEDEVDQHTTNTFTNNKIHLTDQVRKYRRLWCLVSTVLVATFAIGYVVSYQLPRLNSLEADTGAIPTIQAPAPARNEPVHAQSESVRNVPAAARSTIKATQMPPAVNQAPPASKGTPPQRETSK